MCRNKWFKTPKKVELLEVAAASKLHLVSVKSTKRQIIETLIDHGVCQRSPAAVDSVGCVACDAVPVDFTLDCLFYRTVTDHTMHLIPNCSFYQLYACIRGTDETSVNSLDRAAKHASAGDYLCEHVPGVHTSFVTYMFCYVLIFFAGYFGNAVIYPNCG